MITTFVSPALRVGTSVRPPSFVVFSFEVDRYSNEMYVPFIVPWLVPKGILSIAVIQSFAICRLEAEGEVPVPAKADNSNARSRIFPLS